MPRYSDVYSIDDADGAWFGKRLRVQSCFGRNFLLVFWREHEDASKGCCVLAQLIGEPREADKFTYQIDVTRDGVCSLTWKERPRSLHESIESAIASRDCLVFDARQFAEGRKLNVEFTVSTCASDGPNCPFRERRSNGSCAAEPPVQAAAPDHLQGNDSRQSSLLSRLLYGALMSVFTGVGLFVGLHLLGDIAIAREPYRCK
ncbi:hypothetical protein HPB49_002259 [Dermacentor silvarum]|uniref:Uncharacterized protein n=1 Tax=Dermacentor silvarum TaxID=543639 RepID=A0ACB8DI82_DERSI|nr:hypothetical protein HPB49_002259 [Dermacentor silvarum]